MSKSEFYIKKVIYVPGISPNQVIVQIHHVDNHDKEPGWRFQDGHYS